MELLSGIVNLIHEFPDIYDEQITDMSLDYLMTCISENSIPFEDAAFDFLYEKSNSIVTYRELCFDLLKQLREDYSYYGMPYNLWNPLNELDIDILYSWMKNEKYIY